MMNERLFLGGRRVGVGIGNPASENCVAKGGKIKIIETPSGQSGICVFPDGSECEEWAFYRGQCAKGDSSSDINAAFANVLTDSGNAGRDAGLKAGLTVAAVGTAVAVGAWYLLRKRKRR